ncbi:MAG: membrane protein insertion efficiency factor YidD [Bacteriovoracales bacterium]|nr:membrane protein insertion efficiency factor YidD [Bacteriovoracales bacterium]
MKSVFILAIRLYRLCLSPLLGRRCRFSPSCSTYMEECLRTLPLFRAVGLGLSRIAKCHPFHPGGDDPVPKR